MTVAFPHSHWPWLYEGDSVMCGDGDVMMMMMRGGDDDCHAGENDERTGGSADTDG